MARAHDEWRVLRHGTIEKLEDNLWTVTGSTGGPRVTRLFRMMAVKDKAAFKADLGRLAETPNLARIVVSHHEPIVDRPADVLRRIEKSL